MELAMEFEDDLLFADISKQISLLIMDDDEDPLASYPSVSFQDFSREINHTALPSQFTYDQITCRRESKGTGVFIPMSAQPRRKHRQGRHSSHNSKSNRQHHDHHSRKVSHQVSSTTTRKPNH